MGYPRPWHPHGAARRSIKAVRSLADLYDAWAKPESPPAGTRRLDGHRRYEKLVTCLLLHIVSLVPIEETEVK